MYFAGNPMNFETPFDAIYFSLTVTSTVGFGDYIPKSKIDKYIVSLHMLTLFIVLL